MEFRLSKIAPIFFLVLSISSGLYYNIYDFHWPTYIDWLFGISLLILFFLLPYFSIKKQPLVLLNILLIYYLFSIIRGVFIAENYWDYKGLIANSMALFLAVVAKTAINKNILLEIFSFYLKFGLPLLILIFPIIFPGSYGFYLAPLSPLIIFIPALHKYLSIIVISLALFTVFSDLAARSNVIKFVVPFVFLSFYYIPLIRKKGFMEIIRNVLFFLPPLFLFLAISGTFNIFKMDDYIKSDISTKAIDSKGKKVDEDLRADTRTFLYVEVLQTANKYNSWLIGRSPARGNESKVFGKEEKKISGRAERLVNEVAILNIFTWTGLIGVISYFLVFYQASFLAINRSNNIYSQMLGVYIAFRWLYAWVEDINYFTSTTFLLWLAIGMCYSDSFRSMSDLEVKLWVRGAQYKRLGQKLIIFPKKYMHE